MQPPDRIAAYLTETLMLPGVKLKQGERAIYLRALEIFADHPELGFADSVIASHAERHGLSLTTFDSSLTSMPFVKRWRPSGAGEERSP